MPIFDRPPTMFPPIVVPVDSLGDVPGFAFAFGEDVVAWTPPDPFRYRDSDYLFDFREGERALHVHVLRRWSSAAASGVAQVEEQIQKRRRNLQRLVDESARPNPYVVVVPVADEVHHVAGERPEIHIDWWGNVFANNGSGHAGTQSVTTIIGDDGRLARALQVEGNDRLRNRRWPLAEVRAQLRDLFGRRAAWPRADEHFFWTVDVGFSVSSEWSVVDSSRLTGDWDPTGNGEPLERCQVELRGPMKVSEIDIPAVFREDVRRRDRFERRVEVVSSTVPGYGHRLLASCEIRHHPETYVPEPEPDDEPRSPDEDEPVFYPGETLRIAIVQVGQYHAVELRLRIADAALTEFETLWGQVMERLYVSDGKAEDMVDP